ncbi:PP-loop family-domain-containing protein [Mycena galericulata]|nr:PP-loop family-domain-containing protein [Mycena galericulata]
MSLPLRLKPTAISREEFARFFQRCTPPAGWSRNIAVGTSGGPDSACLLFLIHRYLQDMRREGSQQWPSDVVSLTVNHGVQASSDDMAKHCEDLAKSLGVKHMTSNVPWYEHPFPPRPTPGEAFEEIARNARYRMLFEAMKISDADVLALGHHGDDQVETSLMRLGRGTTEIGAGGMRRCRRWGMGANGGESTLGWVGMEGMKRWIVRPLLDVAKDRILVTCDENNLEYITDSTNFQPELTLRNAIRYMLSKNTLDPKSIEAKLPPDISETLDRIQHGIAALESVDMDVTSGVEHLRAAVTVLSEQVEDMDSLVDSSLNRCHLPSPSGTYLVSYRGLATIRDPLIQRGLILRIMRYVSFHAWGTVRADGNRRRSSLEQIIKKLWTSDPFEAKITPFTAGGGVVWTPVLVGAASLRIPVGRTEAGPGEIVAWLASRQPPLSRQRLFALGIPNPLRIDVTQQLRQKLKSRDRNPGQVLEILWDCRFMVHMDIDKVPDDIVEGVLHGKEHVWITTNTRWYWPKVVNIKPNAVEETLLHSTINIPDQGIVKLDRDIMLSWPLVDIDEVTASWIRSEWIRSIAV